MTAPLTTNDIGLPVKPEGSVVVPIDEELIDDGYDSDGLRAPWEGLEENSFDGLEEEETPLPISPEMIPTEMPIAENVAEKILPMISCPK